MKAPNGVVILVVFSAIVAAIAWVVVSSATTPTRAIAPAVVLSACTGVFIWFTATNRHAIARGLIAVGAVCIATPLASVQAVSNDFLFSIMEDTSVTDPRVVDYHRTLDMIFNMLLIGSAIGIVSIVVGGVMHRPPKA